MWAPGVYGRDPAKCSRTFVVLSFKVTENASAYVQFLSHPLNDAVLWEVSSLDYQPGLLDRLTPERQAALVARGFETGASPSNYRREVVIDGDACATAVAHEALDILFEVLGYRGEEALVLHIEAEEADEWDGVSGDFVPGRLAVLLRQDGYHLRTAVGEPSAADRHLVVDVSDDIRITVSAAPDGQRYSVSTPLKDLIRGRDALARTYPNGCVRVACDANGIALLSSDVTLAPGETEERIRGVIGALAMEALQVRFESGDDSVR